MEPAEVPDEVWHFLAEKIDTVPHEVNLAGTAEGVLAFCLGDFAIVPPPATGKTLPFPTTLTRSDDTPRLRKAAFTASARGCLESLLVVSLPQAIPVFLPLVQT